MRATILGMDAVLEERYRQLRQAVADKGLYTRRYGYYALYATLLVGGFVAGWYFITVTTNIYLQLLNAFFLGFVTVQGGMLGHDLSHRQVFESDARNRFFGIIAWGLFGGLSESDWFHIHNTHHEHVNQIDHDPDIDIPFYLSKEQIPRDMGFIGRTLLPYQHITFFFVLPLLYITKLNATWRRAYHDFNPRHIFEVFFALCHFGVLFYLVFAFLPLFTATLFLGVHAVVVGIYMSLVFAPNHKGEEIISADAQVTWLNQITSTRNVYPSSLIFFLFGGLNFQIEHHLFTSMPRPNYWKVHPLVKQFCHDNGIPYYETTWFGSLKEIYCSLKETARVQPPQRLDSPMGKVHIDLVK